MPVRQRSVRRRSAELTPAQMWELTLCPGSRPAFNSEEERATAWEEHRDRLMLQCARHGRRPWGWWTYESPEERDASMTQTLQLYRLGGQLSEQEIVEAKEFWTEQESVARGFFDFWTGHGRPERGAGEYHARRIWAG